MLFWVNETSHLSTRPELQVRGRGRWWSYETQDCDTGFVFWLPSVVRYRQQKPFGLKVRKRLWFQLTANKHIVSREVTADFFHIKQEHDLSQTITKYCQCLNITIKKFNNAVVATNGYCIARLFFFSENKWNTLSVNSLQIHSVLTFMQPARYVH